MGYIIFFVIVFGALYLFTSHMDDHDNHKVSKLDKINTSASNWLGPFSPIIILVAVILFWSLVGAIFA